MLKKWLIFMNEWFCSLSSACLTASDSASSAIPNPSGIRFQLDVKLVSVVLDDPNVIDLVNGHNADDKNLKHAIVDVCMKADDWCDKEEDDHTDFHPVTEFCCVITLWTIMIFNMLKDYFRSGKILLITSYQLYHTTTVIKMWYLCNFQSHSFHNL